VKPDLPLTAADVARLIADPSASVRVATAEKVARAYGAAELSDAERGIAHDIVAALVRDVELRVRRALAENLKDNADLAPEIARRLARDVAEVATPMLECSSVLTDADLVDIVRGGSAAHQAAIARRPAVSEPVAEALVENGDETAVTTLLNNEGARVGDSSLHRALDRFAASTRIGDAMATRRQLPLAITERLVTRVSSSLHHLLMTRHELPPHVAADLLLQAREQALVGLIAESGERDDVSALVDELKRNGRLTPTLILRALATGDLDFFETALAALAGIPVANAYMLIHDPGGRGLAALYQRCGLPEELFPLVRTVVEVARETDYDGGPADRPRFVERMIERVLTRYEGAIGGEDLDWMIARLGRAQAAAGRALV
jgi:uncharacterized protein (DUF2336 family)